MSSTPRRTRRTPRATRSPRYRVAEAGPRSLRSRPCSGAGGLGVLGSHPGERPCRATERGTPDACTLDARGPAAGGPAPGRRPAPPPHRVVVLHRAPRGDRRPNLRLRVRRVPRGAGQLPGQLGEPRRDHGRVGRSLRVRPAERDRAAGGSFAARRQRDTDGLRAEPHRRERCGRVSRGRVRPPSHGVGHRHGRHGARHGRHRPRRRRTLDHGRIGRPRPAVRPARPNRSRRLGDAEGFRSPAAAGPARAAGPPRRRRLGRLRRGRRFLLLLPDADDSIGHARRGRHPGRRHRHGLVRPPVGRLHRGGGRWLGLVRGQPRRRDRPDGVAGPGCGRCQFPRLRVPYPSGWLVAAPGPWRDLRRCAGPLGQPADGRDVPVGLAGTDRGIRPGSPRNAHAPRPGAGYARDDGRRLLGGFGAGHGNERRPSGHRQGIRGADRVRRYRGHGAPETGGWALSPRRGRGSHGAGR